MGAAAGCWFVRSFSVFCQEGAEEHSADEGGKIAQPPLPGSGSDGAVDSGDIPNDGAADAVDDHAQNEQDPAMMIHGFSNQQFISHIKKMTPMPM